MSAESDDRQEVDMICYVLASHGLNESTIRSCLAFYRVGLYSAMLLTALDAVQDVHLRITAKHVEVLRAVEEKKNSGGCSH